MILNVTAGFTENAWRKRTMNVFECQDCGLISHDSREEKGVLWEHISCGKCGSLRLHKIGVD